MIRFICRRIAQILPLLLGLVLLTFFLYRFVPQDPAVALAGDQATREQIEEIRRTFGLDQGLHVQLYTYLSRLAQGDLGFSYFTHRPVMVDLWERLPATLELVIVSLLISVVIGVPAGVIAAWRQDTLGDLAIRIVSILGLAVASFWMAIMLQLLFSMNLDLLPLRGRLDVSTPPVPTVTRFLLIDTLLAGRWDAFVDACRHLVLPALTLASGCSASLVRFTRAGMLDVLKKDYIFYAKAAGYGRRQLLWKFALRNAVTSTVTQIGLLFGALLVGAVVVENIFSWPGLGAYAVGAMYTADLQPLLGVTILIGVMCSVINLIVDVVQAMLDPRIRQHV